MAIEVKEQVICYHCGQVCEEQDFKSEEKSFCCYGCRTVYEILNENNLCEYYSYDTTPGVNLKNISEETYTDLDEPVVKKKLLTFNSDSFAKVDFFIPSIHCISCIWLLENLQRLNSGVVKSEVNFARKRVAIDFDPSVTALSEIARLIASLGYAPQINLSEEKKGEDFF